MHICIQQHRGNSRKQDLHNEDQELWAAHFSVNCPAVKFLDPSPDLAGMSPAKREDATL